MSALTDRVENALNEARMLVLGCQVLLGFEYRGVLEPGFDKLGPETQHVKLVGLLLLLGTLGLLLAPCAYHQIVEGGGDSRRIIAFTNRAVALALLPFACAIGINVFAAAQTVLGPQPAAVVGVAGVVVAGSMWYGVEWCVRWRSVSVSRVSFGMREAVGAAQEELAMEEATPLATRIKQVLTEARVVLPGVQALLGFQFVGMLTDAFEKLPKQVQYVHLVSLGCIALSMVLLMAPAAFHRIVERGEDTQRMQSFSSGMMLAALVPLALGLAGDLYVVVAKVVGSEALGLGLAVLAFVFFMAVWFGLSLAVRWSHDSTAKAAAGHNPTGGARAELVSRR